MYKMLLEFNDSALDDFHFAPKLNNKWKFAFSWNMKSFVLAVLFLQILYVLAYSMYTKGFFSQIVLTNLSKSVLGSPPLLR